MKSNPLTFSKAKHQLLNKFIVFMLATFAFNQNLYASESGPSKLLINGFGTLGLTKGDNELIGSREFVSQKGVFDEYDFAQNSDIGLQLNYQATDKLDLGIQFLAKDRVKNSLDKSLQWAYLNYAFSPNFDVKVGRMGVDVYLMSEYKHVGFTHPWTHLPSEFYGFLPIDSYDGITGTYKYPLFNGLLRVKGWLGQSTYYFYTPDQTEEELPVDLSRTIGTSVAWENDIWDFKLTYIQSKTKEDNLQIKQLENQLQLAASGWPEVADYSNLSLDNTTSRYYAAGFMFDDSDWVIQSEISLIETESLLSQKKLSSYLSVGKRFRDFTPYVMGSITRSTDDRVIFPTAPAPFLQPLQQGAQQAFNKFYSNQHTISIGTRWDFSPKIAFKAQWDRTWIQPYGNALFEEKNGVGDEKSELNTYSITMDFLF